MGSLISEISIANIYLMLGGACNFKCRHCIQECSGLKEFNINQKISQEVVDYVWHLIKIRPDDQDKLKVLFWGGEPLVYFNTIQDFVDIFNNNVEYVIITNGELLTQTIVDYVNEHDISVVLSNDGEKTSKIRIKNMLDDKRFIDLFKQVKHKAVDAVVHAYNVDYQGLQRYLQAKLGDVFFYTEQLIVSWNMPEDIYKTDLTAYKQSLEILANEAYNDIINAKETFAVRVFFNDLCNIAFGRRSKRILPNCLPVYRSMSIDLQGNVYTCHNSNTVIGKVTDERLYLVKKYDEWIANKWNSKCLDCQYFELCRGGCPLELNNSQGNKMSCERLKVYYDCCYKLAERLNNYYEPVDLGE